MTLSVDGKEIQLPEKAVDALKQINQIRTTVRINGQGEFVAYRPDFKAVPRDVREDVSDFVLGLIKSFDAARAPLPAGEVAFGKPWKGTRELMIGSIGPTETAVVDLNYSYLGTRTRLGRPEALLNLEGLLRGQKGPGVNVSGKMRGDAGVDLETGQIVFANTTVDVDFDIGEGKRKRKASGTYKVNLFQLIFKEPTKK